MNRRFFTRLLGILPLLPVLARAEPVVLGVDMATGEEKKAMTLYYDGETVLTVPMLPVGGVCCIIRTDEETWHIYGDTTDLTI